jgi:enolase
LDVTKLEGLKALPVIDSNGRFTIKVTAYSRPYHASAIVPSGSSTGKYEARVVSVDKAVKRVLKLGKSLKAKELGLVDQLITKEPGNVSTGVSMAVHRLMAKVEGKELFEFFGGKTLPVPFFNVINGGVHAGNNLAFQEFLIAPQAKTFKKSLMIGVKVYHALKDYLKKNYGVRAINVGMEGGFAPALKSVEEPLKILTRVINNLGYSKSVGLALDAAATQFYSQGHYVIDGKKFSVGKLIDYYEKLVNDYGIISIEDPFFEEDFRSFSLLRQRVKARIVGDDLLATNPDRVLKGVTEGSCDCLLLKVNQVGTVSKALKSAEMVKDSGWDVMVSHRSGDSCDDFIADLAVGINAGLFKSGAPARGERVSKYNRLLEIEELLGKKAKYSSL